MRHLLVILLIMLSFGVRINAQTVVTLDYYFNHETRKSASGEQERFHYLWEDTTNTGFSVLGEAFRKQGTVLKSLEEAPTAANLKGSGIYIIVDPDSRRESLKPNYILQKDIDQIERWVRNGGVLFLLANDSANVELPHFNQLAGRFGMRFNNDLQNHVVDDNHFVDGSIITKGNSLFRSAPKIFMKDVCSIGLNGDAKPILKNKDGAVILASAKHGKGFVLAVGDPWLYNEYTNGRLPVEFENDKAANDIATYLIKRAKLVKAIQ
jgi:hypothetical protein